VKRLGGTMMHPILEIRFTLKILMDFEAIQICMSEHITGATAL